MQKSELPFSSRFDSGKDNADSVGVAKLAVLADDWLTHCDLERHSKRTIAQRRIYLNRLLQFLWDKKMTHCGKSELRQFFSCLNNKTTGEPLRPSAAETYHRNIAAFFNWLVKEGDLETSPMRRVPKPKVPKDQIQPLNDMQQLALIEAARNSYFGERNYAIVLFLLDTGARASEVCTLDVEDLDLDSYKAQLVGKGNKKRTVHFGKRTARALFHYLPKERLSRPHSPVFVALSGPHTAERMTRSGVYKVVSECGASVGIKGVRCSPHTLRHTFAVNYLRNGGKLLALQMLLGHEDLKMSSKYIALAEADLAQDHRRSSPVDRLGK